MNGGGQYGDDQNYYGQQQNAFGGQMGGGPPNAAPPMAPPPIAPPPPPPPQQSSKNVYGPSAVPERVQVAKTVAHSVLSPENNNSRGQNMFLRRQANSEKWTTSGGGGGQDDSGYGMSGGSNNVSGWGVARSNSQQGPTADEYGAPQGPDHRQTLRSSSQSPRPGMGMGSVDLAQGGKGGQLFAKRKERAERWAAKDEVQAQNTGRAPAVIGSAGPQQPQAPGSYRPMKMNVISRANAQPTSNFGPSSTYNTGGSVQQPYGFTDL
jgi:hypothetical protein